jgi:RNase H-like domain found in reverse transcriptase/Reverse transcriptase (RNA-dependent DNA polymerase)
MIRVGYEPHGGVEYPLGVEDPPVQAVSLNQPTSAVINDRRKRNGHSGRTFPLRPVIWCLRIQALAHDLAHLLPQQRETVFHLLAKHRKMWDGRLDRVNATTHRIDLVPGAKPVHSQPYRAGPRAREAESAELQRILKEGVIGPASSELASPVVLVPKPDGTLRFCVDYRKLNAVTNGIPTRYLVWTIVLTPLEMQIFTTLDCNSGYWQIQVAPEDIEKTTFTSHEGTFQFNRMPFRLRNAPATFQRTVDIVLSGLRWKTCLVYLDDIIVFSNSPEEHARHLDEVLSLLYGAGLSLKLANCSFFRDTVNYLGHVIRTGKLEVATKYTDALETAKPPTTKTELRSFLGLCNVYRRFVPSFAKVASPLNALLRKGERPELGILTDEQVSAFNALREKLTHPPVLTLPKKEGLFVLDTDASAEQIGCCLFQEQVGGPKLPLGYWSRSLNPAERNYSTTEKECLAIVWAILQLPPYLEGQRFLIRTDHNSLHWVLNISDAQGRLARWRLRLLEFNFEVEYSPGKEHHGADTMSRLQTDPQIQPPFDTEIPCFTVEDDEDPGLTSIEDLVESQHVDPTCRQLCESLVISSAVDYDSHGVIGNVLPSGEFHICVPPTLTTSTLVVTELASIPYMMVREEAHHLRRGDTACFPLHETDYMTQAAIMATEVAPVAIPIDEIIREQATDPECQQFGASAGVESLFDYEDSGALVRRAPLDKALQIVVPNSLQPRVLHL